MSIIHILHGVKFVEPTIDLFEKHFPGENIYIIARAKDVSSFTRQLEIEFIPNLLTSSVKQNELTQRIISSEVDSVIFHCLNKRKATLAYKIKSVTNATLYWMFFGVELYDLLYKMDRYALFDAELNRWAKKILYYFGNFTSFIRFGESRTKAIIKGFGSIDYFCCWNECDYKLLGKNYPVKCAFKNFYYYSLYRPVPAPPTALTGRRKVMVNHSGSSDGNHLTILEKLKNIDHAKDIEILTPLSYGSAETIREVKRFCLDCFGERSQLITEFLPRDKYFEVLKAYPIAIFGHRRQEAAGNIFRLLAAGVKVFLREDNNMLKWLRSRDFIVFSFEKDLNSLADLEPLHFDQVLENNNIYNSIFSEDEEEKTMGELFTSNQ